MRRRFIPAQAGTQTISAAQQWIPAAAGVTIGGATSRRRDSCKKKSAGWRIFFVFKIIAKA